MTDNSKQSCDGSSNQRLTRIRAAVTSGGTIWADDAQWLLSQIRTPRETAGSRKQQQTIVGWMVGEPTEAPAMYNLHEYDRASYAARRWNRPITALTICANSPSFAPRPAGCYSSDDLSPTSGPDPSEKTSPAEPRESSRDDDAMVREFMLQVQELAEPDLEQPDTRRYTLTELEDCMRSAIGNRRSVEPSGARDWVIVCGDSWYGENGKFVTNEWDARGFPSAGEAMGFAKGMRCPWSVRERAQVKASAPTELPAKGRQT